MIDLQCQSGALRLCRKPFWRGTSMSRPGGSFIVDVNSLLCQKGDTGTGCIVPQRLLTP